MLKKTGSSHFTLYKLPGIKDKPVSIDIKALAVFSTSLRQVILENVKILCNVILINNLDWFCLIVCLGILCLNDAFKKI